MYREKVQPRQQSRVIVRQQSQLNVFQVYTILGSSLCTSNRRQFLGFLLGQSLGTLGELGLSLETHDTATPLPDKIGIVVELLESQVLQERQLTLISLVNTSEANDSSSLHVHECTETSLVLDNHERDLHLTAKGRHPHDQFDRVHIVGNQDETRLLVFDQCGNVLETVLDLKGSLWGSFLTFSGSNSGFLNTLLLGSRSRRAVLVEKSKDRHGFILSNRLGKLINSRRDLQALVQDSALTLQAHVTRPLDKAGQITTSGTNISTNGKGTRAAGKERVRGLGGLWFGLVLFGLWLGVFLGSLLQ